MRIMRMRAERAINVGKAVRYREHFGLPPNARGDRDHALDAGGAGTCHHRIELFGKIREIEMAMAVDQHWRSIARLLARHSAEKPPPAPEALRPRRCDAGPQDGRSSVRPLEPPRDRAISPSQPA